ncbi:hypothetical protein [Persicobacter psychrovividus]|uniref:Initiator Rep protein domain-containing protein n=1 Tax=Persicobacter psychrovividus TaxID=387638 RepID=A0ABN6LHC5_9BACT|nr:hypothetical protein PEPS_32090 [Persicobacter psychrovividus]
MHNLDKLNLYALADLNAVTFNELEAMIINLLAIQVEENTKCTRYTITKNSLAYLTCRRLTVHSLSEAFLRLGQSLYIYEKRDSRTVKHPIILRYKLFPLYIEVEINHKLLPFFYNTKKYLRGIKVFHLSLKKSQMFECKSK